MNTEAKLQRIEKYNVAGPRYTSYPTVPFWDVVNFSSQKWKSGLLDYGKAEIQLNGLSLYIHLPYCESLCTFCACHKRITKNHGVEESYIQAVLAEWQMYVDLLKDKPNIKEIHLGGGTPSFFSAQNLGSLINEILEKSDIDESPIFSFEGHPNNTTEEHLQALFDLGFRRVSFGVQDYDPIVQKAIHRIQPFEAVENVTLLARKIGYTSVSHDLVFGLPFQKMESIKNTILKTLELKPDRIAFYSYAHVPWIKGNGQRGFDEQDLPSPSEKRALYEAGLEMFESAGYFEVGMDHFALPGDELFVAMEANKLHRNFMGYTTQSSKAMIGLGASSISDIWGAFAQNSKDIEVYKREIFEGNLSLEKGHILSEVDLFVRKQILNLMCHFNTKWTAEELVKIDSDEIYDELKEMERDGILVLKNDGIEVLERAFVRNICMVFDQYLQRNQKTEKLFSQTI
ncbi:oxygen-independent coproporphyrinogen III oxidase [Lacihabitans sp. LS3-19]|uniref:oxygen-independent coproporphyrinogen III oxidase n=1 Tax=Lacihabitans sp. LS3-19 TaxID=2487335 RepID=UPI0020CEFBC9|nr:oxygen-independent coproporphyrinogen III oxidase [Lacihabitans sp. LS3-19]MCP9766899.1 oxygen-independent coproporphyrinogen III oxidase [Lacihabitans sp. LS3-19]